MNEDIKPILDELKKISKIITLAFGDVIEKELEKVCTTNERKKMWVLIDNNRMSKDIAKEVGVTIRAVDKFLKIAQNAGLIENPKGKPPKKIVEYTPPKWIELLIKPGEENEKNG